jgi:prepilin-type N-terminal cleavage/methylation domain-containing protein
MTGLQTRVHVGRRGGFTLIELLLVLALMTAMNALDAPRMSRFFEGHGVNDQARRLLQVTRYARSQAVTTGIPMQVWIDPQTGEYGITPLEGYNYRDAKPVQYRIEEMQKFELGEDYPTDADGRAGIVFRPDGLIEEGALETIELVGGGGESIVLRRSDQGSKYEIEIGTQSSTAQAQ